MIKQQIKEKQLVFDAGPVINLAINNLLWVLKYLKQRYNGRFCITSKVKEELVDKPLKTKRFKLESLQVLRQIRKDIIEVKNTKEINNKTNELLNLANKIYYAFDNPINIVHYGEMSSVALAIINNADAMVVDERNTRILIEEPETLLKILKKKIRTEIKINKKNLEKFKELTKKIKLIRSVELIIVAYDLGLLKDYLMKDNKQPNRLLLEALLWGLKLNGCSISDKEINKIIKIENK